MVWESDKFMPLNQKGLVATVVSLKNDGPALSIAPQLSYHVTVGTQPFLRAAYLKWC